MIAMLLLVCDEDSSSVVYNALRLACKVVISINPLNLDQVGLPVVPELKAIRRGWLNGT